MDAYKNEFLDIVQNDVNTIFASDFTYETVLNVPNIFDTEFTYADGDEQRGQEIETSVLFVDVRDSVKINSTKYQHTKGRMYTSFVRSVLRAAKHHNGKVKNIIGDRVMIVFPHEKCFKNAVDCAVNINYIANHIIHSKLNDFRVGIGIDFGKMKVYKVGLPVPGQENVTNKNFVWIGEANFASRLTDMANKEREGIYGLFKRLRYGYFTRTEKVELSAIDLAEQLSLGNNGNIESIEVIK